MSEQSDDGGAWAGDEIPVPEPPTGVVAHRGTATPSPISDSAGAVGSPAFGNLAAERSTTAEDVSTFWTRRNRIIAAVAVAGCVVIATALTVGGADDSASTDTPTTTTDAPDDTLQRTSTTSEAPPPRPPFHRARCVSRCPRRSQRSIRPPRS